MPQCNATPDNPGFLSLSELRPTCCTPSANDHPPKPGTDVKSMAYCPLTSVKMHQPVAPGAAGRATKRQPRSRRPPCA
eukprot:1128289-Prymnesium_polylepis.1